MAVIPPSFHVRRDAHFDSVSLGNDNKATQHQYKVIKYTDNWVAQEDLVEGDDFQVQIIANGNTITFTWNTVIVAAGAGGAVTELEFVKKIPLDLLSNLSGTDGQGQNFPIYVNDSNQNLLWIDTDGTIRIAIVSTTVDIAAAEGQGTVWGASVTWTTIN